MRFLGMWRLSHVAPCADSDKSLTGKGLDETVGDAAPALSTSRRTEAPAVPTSIQSKRPSPSSRPSCARLRSELSKACGPLSDAAPISSSSANAKTISSWQDTMHSDRKSLLQSRDRRFRGHINRNPDYGVLQDEAAMECAAARPSLTIFGVVVGKSEAAR